MSASSGAASMLVAATSSDALRSRSVIVSISPSFLVAVAKQDRRGVEDEEHDQQHHDTCCGEELELVLRLLDPVVDMNRERGERARQCRVEPDVGHGAHEKQWRGLPDCARECQD